MSIALIRGNMITLLANQGFQAHAEVKELVIKELSSDPNNPLALPEDMMTMLELVERSYRAATPLGKEVLAKSIEQILGEFREDRCPEYSKETQEVIFASAAELKDAFARHKEELQHQQ